MLQARERGFGFLIREVDADGTGSEQGDCDERQDQQQVFSKQPAAMHASRRQRFDVREYFLVHYRIIGSERRYRAASIVEWRCRVLSRLSN